MIYSHFFQFDAISLHMQFTKKLTYKFISDINMNPN